MRREKNKQKQMECPHCEALIWVPEYPQEPVYCQRCKRPIDE